MDKTVALRNTSNIMLLISVLAGVGVGIWNNRKQLIEFIKNIFGKQENTDQQQLEEDLHLLQRQRIEEEKNK